MNKNISGLLKLSVVGCLSFFYFFGCVPHTVSKKKEALPPPSPIKQITAVTVEENADMVDVWIKGSGILTYTSVKQPSPLGVILYLPETVFDEAVAETEPENKSSTASTVRIRNDSSGSFPLKTPTLLTVP